MNNIESRIQGVEIVQNHREVLSDVEFLDAMIAATRIRIDENSELSIMEFLFGRKLQEVEDRMKRLTVERTVLMDQEVPKALRLLFVKTRLYETQSWEEFKKEFKD